MAGTTFIPNIQYQGYTLPRDAKTPQKVPVDQSNNPALVIIGGTSSSAALSLQLAIVAAASGDTSPLNNNGVILPADVVIDCEFEKVIAEAGILDGVDVTEHIRRKASDIEFAFTLRANDQNGNAIFPQEDLETLMSNLFDPNTVLTIQNTYLNKRGISEIIIKKISPKTIRGLTHIPVRIIAKENMKGQSLIISS